MLFRSSPSPPHQALSRPNFSPLLSNSLSQSKIHSIPIRPSPTLSFIDLPPPQPHPHPWSIPTSIPNPWPICSPSSFLFFFFFHPHFFLLPAAAPLPTVRLAQTPSHSSDPIPSCTFLIPACAGLILIFVSTTPLHPCLLDHSRLPTPTFPTSNSSPPHCILSTPPPPAAP